MSTTSLPSLNFLAQSKVFTIMENCDIFLLLFLSISVSFTVKKDVIFYSNFHSSRCLYQYVLQYFSLDFKHVSRVSCHFVSSDLDFLSMASFSYDLWLRKINSGKVYLVFIKAILRKLPKQKY